MRHKPLFSKFHRITAWQKSFRDPKIRPIHAIFRLFESDTPFFLWIKKNLFMTLELKFHVINNPKWSNFIIIYGFHGLPLYRFDRFNAVHYNKKPRLTGENFLLNSTTQRSNEYLKVFRIKWYATQAAFF